MQEYSECNRCNRPILQEDVMHKLTSTRMWESSTTAQKRKLMIDVTLCKNCFAKKFKNKLDQKFIETAKIETPK